MITASTALTLRQRSTHETMLLCCHSRDFFQYARVALLMVGVIDAFAPARQCVKAPEETKQRRRALPGRSTIRAATTLERSDMNELVKLRQQISDLEKQAADLQKKNRPAVLAELREQMAAYGITAEELSHPAPKARPKASPAKPASPARGKKAVVSSPAKYRGPEGQQWTGRGTAPKWLNDLVAGGKTREDFLIAPDAAASGSAAAE
jgi:DNA-binding protein H-NS